MIIHRYDGLESNTLHLFQLYISRAFLFEYRYWGEKLTFECRFQCAVGTFNTLPATVLGAL
jgi:hypothetical protein